MGNGGNEFRGRPAENGHAMIHTVEPTPPCDPQCCNSPQDCWGCGIDPNLWPGTFALEYIGDEAVPAYKCMSGHANLLFVPEALQCQWARQFYDPGCDSSPTFACDTCDPVDSAQEFCGAKSMSVAAATPVWPNCVKLFSGFLLFANISFGQSGFDTRLLIQWSCQRTLLQDGGCAFHASCVPGPRDWCSVSPQSDTSVNVFPGDRCPWVAQGPSVIRGSWPSQHGGMFVIS